MKNISVFITLICFCCSVFFTEDVYSENTNVFVQRPLVKTVWNLASELRDRCFELPEELGYVQDSFFSGADKTIIHIQDAHCNYYAQKSIRKLIEYFREKYGITLICLEGGIGEYDLLPFMEIKSSEVRSKCADFFLKEGTLNAAEYTSVENPGKFLLWGVEEEALYIKNLQVYRQGIRYRERIGSYLKQISHVINNLKRHIYSDNLLRMERKCFLYRNNKITLKEYLAYLMESCGDRKLADFNLVKILRLKQVMDIEDKIDFKKAAYERERFIEELRQIMPPIKIEGLIKNAVLFGQGKMNRRKFYDYLIEAGKDMDIRIREYPEFQKYAAYVSMYDCIDRASLFKEISRIENELREAMCENEKELRLVRFSRDFDFMKKAFDFFLTKDEFDYFRPKMDDFGMAEFLSFLRKESIRYAEFDVDIDVNAEELDERLKEIKLFYEYSFERDKAFQEKIKEKTEETGLSGAILITGGFHTENLVKIFKNAGYSYVTILPHFQNEEDYVSPYFKILSGIAYSPLGETIKRAVRVSTLQVCTIWNELGVKIEGHVSKNLALLELEIAERMMQGRDAFLALKGTNRAVRFFMKGENVFCEIAPATDQEELTIVNISDFEYEKKLESNQNQVSAPESTLVSLPIFLEEKASNAVPSETDFLKENEIIGIEDACLIFNKNNGERVSLKIGSLIERIPRGSIETVNLRAKQISFVKAEVLADFLKEWDVLTIEDNSYTAGFVDIKKNQNGRRVLYITETIRAAANIAPELIPIIILGEISRTDRHEDRDISKTFFTNQVKEFNLVKFSLPLSEIMPVIRASCGTDQSAAELAKIIFKLKPRAWVFFGDIMAGRDFSQYLGKEFMDILRPEATETILKQAKNQGVFAYHYGLDEHVFLFPEEWDETDTAGFFIKLRDELLKGSNYAFFEIRRQNITEEFYKLIAENNEKYKDNTKMRITLKRKSPVVLSILVPKELIASFYEWMKKNGIKYFSEEKIYPFILPAGGVRLSQEAIADFYEKYAGSPFFEELPAGLEEMLGFAEERAGQKFRRDEIKGMSESERVKLWEGLTHEQQIVVTVRAFEKLFPGSEKESENNEVPISLIMLHGLSGLNKNFFFAKEIDPRKMRTVKLEAKKYVLKEDTTFEDSQAGFRDDQRARIDSFFAKNFAKKPGENEEYDVADEYTGYNTGILKDFLEKILKLTREDAEKLKPEERVFILREKPIDFYVIIIGKKGEFAVLNVDSMFHVENLPKEKKDEVKKELKEGLMQRDTDFVILTAEKEKKDKYLREIVLKNIRDKELDERYGEVGMRVYPLKAANSYLGHDVSDNYILAACKAVYSVFVKAVKDCPQNTEYAIDAKMIDIAMGEAVIDMNGLIDKDKFKKAACGKEPLLALLEAHVVLNGILNAPLLKTADDIIKNINSMSAVRSLTVALADGKVVGKDGSYSWIRTYDPDRGEEYTNASREQQGYSAIKSKMDLNEKTKFIIEESKKALEEIRMKERIKEVKKFYASAKCVITSSRNITAPLIVFIQCPFYSEASLANVSSQALKEIRDKYDTNVENIKLVFFRDKDDLKEKSKISSAVLNLLNLAGARGVVFCRKGSDIHPGVQNEKDIFKQFRTKKNEPKVYYIEEEFEGFKDTEESLPLIGPHIALAVGIKEIKRGNLDFLLLTAVNRLFMDISGGEVKLMNTTQEIVNFIDKLLELKETLKIKKIDFDTLREQVKAEEKAMISL